MRAEGPLDLYKLFTHAKGCDECKRIWMDVSVYAWVKQLLELVTGEAVDDEEIPF